MSKNNDIFNILFAAAGLVGVGYAVCAHTKLAKISERLDKSIDNLAEDMEIDIPEELVNKAVERAVQDEASRAVRRATDETILALKRDIRSEVQKAVDKEYESIKSSVLKEVTDSAAKIDTARVRRDVEAAAKKAVLEKFDDNLDDILDKFNENLDNTAKIYSSIRETLTQSSKSGKEYVIRVD